MLFQKFVARIMRKEDRRQSNVTIYELFNILFCRAKIRHQINGNSFSNLRKKFKYLHCVELKQKPQPDVPLYLNSQYSHRKKNFKHYIQCGVEQEDYP